MAKSINRFKNTHNTARTLSALSSVIGAMSGFRVADYFLGEVKQCFLVSIRWFILTLNFL